MANNRLKSLCLSFHKISINNKALPRTNIETRFSDKQLQLARGYGHGDSGGWGGGGEGGFILPYISDVGMCGPKREEFLYRFDRNLGLDFAHFGLKSWFSRELRECMNV